MSYKLADGTMSTNYVEGDMFKVSGTVYELIEDDGTSQPKFRSVRGEREPNMYWWLYWSNMTHVKDSSQHTRRELRKAIDILEQLLGGKE